jgi:hypothetical protein
MRIAASFVLLVLALLAPRLVPVVATPLPCPGDCQGDQRVTLEDLLVGINLALGVQPPSACINFDIDKSESVTVDEIVAAIDAALNGCPSATPPATPTESPTQTATFSQTATPTPNGAPLVPQHAIYRTYPGRGIHLALGVIDPEGGAVRCIAPNPPEGAALDAETAVFTWTPREDQLGPFHVPFSCSDQAEPPAVTNGVLLFKVEPPDLCAEPVCNAQSGCEISLPPLTEMCCEDEPSVRVAEPEADCPVGSILFVGRNLEGFGRLQNCDRMRIDNFAQVGATAFFHLQTRCIDFEQAVLVHARMETASRGVVFDQMRRVDLIDSNDGFAGQRFVDFPIDNPPYFDLQDAEADLHVVVRDVRGMEVSQSLRLKLTFTPIPDLPEANPLPTPTAPPAL